MTGTSLLFVSLLILTAGGAFAAEDLPGLPASVQAAMEQAEREVARNRVAYEDANRKVFDVAEKSLRTELDKLIKEGKLDEAIATKGVLEGLREFITSKVDEKKTLIGEGGVKILIPASKITTISPDVVMGGSYPYMLWANGPGAFYELPVQVPKGKYYLYALLAAGESRPCRIIVNKVEVGTCCEIVTGGFTIESLKPDKFGPFEADGKTSIRIEAKGASPHFYGFLITQDSNASLSIADFVHIKE